MSTVIVSLGRARNSSQLHDFGSSTAPLIVKLDRSSGWCGVGPAESTGKSPVTYWPGGTRDESASGRRRPRKPREIGVTRSPRTERMSVGGSLLRLKPCLFSLFFARRWPSLGEAADEVERGVCDLAPAVVDRERVPAARDRLELGHRIVSLLAVVEGLRDRRRHGVV